MITMTEKLPVQDYFLKVSIDSYKTIYLTNLRSKTDIAYIKTPHKQISSDHKSTRFYHCKANLSLQLLELDLSKQDIDTILSYV